MKLDPVEAVHHNNGVQHMCCHHTKCPFHLCISRADRQAMAYCGSHIGADRNVQLDYNPGYWGNFGGPSSFLWYLNGSRLVVGLVVEC